MKKIEKYTQREIPMTRSCDKDCYDRGRQTSTIIFSVYLPPSQKDQVFVHELSPCDLVGYLNLQHRALI